MDTEARGTPVISRNALLKAAMLQGSATLAGLALLRLPIPADAFAQGPGEVVIPWLDQPPPNPVPNVIGHELQWEKLTWRTPNDKFFTVHHYNLPVIAEKDWRLEISGLVQQPRTFTLAELRARPRREVTFTIECGGNHGFPGFTGGIGNATWAGTPLAAVLQEAGVLDEGKEVIFWGSDSGKEKVRGTEFREQFARSMGLADAMSPDNLLCYEMNGEPLPQSHGFPMRLVAPGWYGVANVKWLQRIEVLNTRLENRFMGRDYVTIREEQRDGLTVARFTSVGRALLKSAPAKVTRKDGAYRIIAAAWGAPIARVDVQIDGGPWRPATVEDREGAAFAWTLWFVDWGSPTPGVHTITSRAIDAEGRIQPTMDDPQIANKRTYWESNGQITRRVRTLPRTP
jgi:DMSO/TMAO reductase YedYZ molybdopterin-dependent catalytic subunit